MNTAIKAVTLSLAIVLGMTATATADRCEIAKKVKAWTNKAPPKNEISNMLANNKTLVDKLGSGSAAYPDSAFGPTGSAYDRAYFKRTSETAAKNFRRRIANIAAASDSASPCYVCALLETYKVVTQVATTCTDAMQLLIFRDQDNTYQSNPDYKDTISCKYLDKVSRTDLTNNKMNVPFWQDLLQSVDILKKELISKKDRTDSSADIVIREIFLDFSGQFNGFSRAHKPDADNKVTTRLYDDLQNTECPDFQDFVDGRG